MNKMQKVRECFKNLKSGDIIKSQEYARKNKLEVNAVYNVVMHAKNYGALSLIGAAREGYVVDGNAMALFLVRKNPTAGLNPKREYKTRAPKRSKSILAIDNAIFALQKSRELILKNEKIIMSLASISSLN